MHTPEWHEKQKIKKYLDQRGAWYFSPFMAGRGMSGIPDLIACLNLSGKFVGIEVKQPGKKPTPMQNRRMAEIISIGGLAIWGDADRVIEQLQKLI